MQPTRSSARLAVALHNREHPFPWGVVVVVGLIAIIIGYVYVSGLESPESKASREESQKVRAKLQQTLDQSYEEQRKFNEKSLRESEIETQKLIDKKDDYREERYEPSGLTEER